MLVKPHILNLFPNSFNKFNKTHVRSFIYSKTYVKRPLKNRQNKDLNDKW